MLVSLNFSKSLSRLHGNEQALQCLHFDLEISAPSLPNFLSVPIGVPDALELQQSIKFDLWRVPTNAAGIDQRGSLCVLHLTR